MTAARLRARCRAERADVDRAQDRRLQRRLVFLDVERDLHVGDAPAQRPDEPQRDAAPAKTANVAMRNPVTDGGLNL